MQVRNRVFFSNIAAYLLLQEMEVFLLIYFCFAISEKTKKRTGLSGWLL